MKGIRRGFVKLGVILIALIGIMIPIVYANNKGELQAASTSPSFGAPTFALYDKVVFGDKLFTVIDNDASFGNVKRIKMLADEMITKDSVSSFLWQSNIWAFPNSWVIANFGRLSQPLVSTTHSGADYGKIAYPSTDDLVKVTSGTKLHTGEDKIPAISSDWWLSNPPLNNRSKFVAANTNALDVKKKLTVATVTSKTTCGTKEIEDDPGVMITTSKKDADVSEEFFKPGPIIGKYSISGGGNYGSQLGLFSDNACKSYQGASSTQVKILESPFVIGTDLPRKFSLTPDGKQASYRQDYSATGAITSQEMDNQAALAYLLAKRAAYDTNSSTGEGVGYGTLDFKKNGSYTITATTGLTTKVCTSFSPQCEGSKCEVMNTANPSVKKSVESARNSVGTLDNTNKIIIKVQNVSQPQVLDVKKTCTGRTQPAGKAAERPMVELLKRDIVLGNSVKRTYTPNLQLNAPVPMSDNTLSALDRKYMTLQMAGIPILTMGEPGVTSAYKIETNPDENGIISLPIQLHNFYTDLDEGTNYISAVAKKKNGDYAYGVLKEFTGTSGIVEVDVSNIDQDPDGTYRIKLYIENSGPMETAYISKGTDIEIHSIIPQAIAIDANQPTTVTYGDMITVTSHLSSDLASQAATDILYSIKTSGGATAQASIVSQSYNATTGVATATIKPLTGTGQFTLAIDKAGTSSSPAASQQTMNITMNPKEITVTPTKPSKVYAIGEPMPTLTATSSGLVSGDSIPSGLIPMLEPLSVNDPAHPASNGATIDESGKWKLVFASNALTGLTTFTDKYDVILEDYDEDSTLVFETSIASIPAGWVVVTPNANSAGWNNQSVVITPSAAAFKAGYETVVLVDVSGNDVKYGASITYSTETNSEIPNIALRKGTNQSDPQTIREIKIDVTAPTVSSSIANETIWTNTPKTVTLTTADNLSGVANVSVMFGSTPMTVTGVNGIYNFDADVNGTYSVTVLDEAGNSKTHSVEVENIDTSTLGLTAKLEPFATSDHRTQDITLTTSVGSSGISSYQVFYKNQASASYGPDALENLDKSVNPLTYVAKMNGFYKFVLTSNTNEVVDAEIETTDLNPPIPCTQVSAVLDDANSTPYTNNTWTNKDVILTLTNTNIDVTGTITWEVEEDDNGTWTAVNGNTYRVSTTAWLNKKLKFKATSSDGAIEISPTSFKVKIDKEKPSVPTIVDEGNYTSNDWHGSDVTISATTTSKNSQINQSIYVRDVSTGAWTLMSGNMHSLTSNGTYEREFKVIDEAGNESDVSNVITVNIDDRQPVITIELNEHTLNSILNQLTLGYFFNETVKVDISADFGNDGTLYYIIDNSATPSEPASNDPRWIQGTTTSIVPDNKAMIYVKAVSKAGVETIDSTIYYVYADVSNPDITLPAPQTSWTNVNKIEAVLNDSLSGINVNTIFYNVQGGTDVKVTPSNGKVSIQPLLDGDYDVSVKGEDNSGNAKISTTHVKIDTVKPIISAPSASISGWAKTRTITFNASDVLSGLNGLPTVSGNALGAITVTPVGGDVYSFDVNDNDTYVITVLDKAGNSSTKNYVENNIDVTPPTITKTIIENETIIKAKKKVSFDVTDMHSNIQKVSVTYLKDGVNKPVLVTDPTSGHNYFFNAQENGVYTITAVDKAGNTTTETVTVSNIDPNGIKIIDISDISEWVKDDMDISFRVQAGTSGIHDDYPKVSCDGNPIIPTENAGVYRFTASQNGTCRIDVKNKADDVADETLVITHIDELAPQISDVSSNITSTTYREPQDITLRIQDYNVADKSSIGSGFAAGYPNLYYMENGVKIPVSIIEDVSDKGLYHFLADRNTTYVVEAIDAVGHALVSQNIVVDHIVNASDLEELVVVATHDTTAIASGTWVDGDITFTLSGGLNSSILEKYQYAISNGAQPVEADWQDISNPIDAQHVVSAEQSDQSYYFRAVPTVSGATISNPFVVNIDTTDPIDMKIVVNVKNANPIARFINTLSFGMWMNEEQEVSFEATDNYSDASQMRYQYAEEENGVIGPWKSYSGSLSYSDTNIILHAKAMDLADNESIEVVEYLLIDTLPPTISGVQDQSVYKQYYLPRFISYADTGSGVLNASFSKDGASAEVLTQNHKIKGSGTYVIDVEDNAGNMASVTFKIVDLPNLDNIDGSDESKDIIDQIQQELDDIKDKIDDTEKKDYEDWVEDASDKWTDSRKTVIEDEDKTSKVEGVDDTTFDPFVELVVEPIEENDLPQLPRKAKYSFDVYLKKGDAQIQPNGNVKVYLPYPDKEAPIVYEIDENGVVREISTTMEGNHVVFVTNALRKYAISNAKEESEDIKVPGPDSKLDTDDDVIAKPNPDGDKPIKKPDGSVEVPPKGSVVYPDGGIVDTPNGGILHPDGSLELPNGDIYDPEGNKKPDEGICVVGPDGIPGTADDVCGSESDKEKPDKKPDGSIEVPPGGSIVFPGGDEIETPNGGIIHPDGSVTLPDGTEFDPEGNEKPKTCDIKDGVLLNQDSDGDNLPDINLDIDDDCIAELNVDSNRDGKPDVDIDSDGDGKADINIDVDHDGDADINIVLISEWKPEKNCTYNGFSYDTMADLKPKINVDDDGDGTADRNVDSDGDGEPDTNVDSDYYTKTPNGQGGSVLGAFTGDASSWSMWLLLMGVNAVVLCYSIYRNKKKKKNTI